MIDLNNLATEAARCAINRVKITGHHCWDDYMKDLSEEVIELSLAGNRGLNGLMDEIPDIILVCMSIASVYGIDIEKAIIKKMEYNEKRKD
jgi:NTP pyrophosphatase (non-canonical NTP hydrolase)